MKKPKDQKRNNKKPPVYIGTSGWMYKSWHEMFYPRGLKTNFLTFYANHYNSLEINTTFYHLPKKKVFEKWHKETPANFVFAIKLSRYITHIRRLKNCRLALRRYFRAASGLKNKLAVILIQLPPSLSFKEKIAKKFFDDITEIGRQMKLKVLLAVEPRHPSWYESQYDTIRSLIKKYGMTLVFAHSSVFPLYDPDNNDEVFSDFVYVRFHGPKEFAASEYGIKRLIPWAKRIKMWQKAGKTVFAYFNDDAKGYAIKDARILSNLVAKKSLRKSAN